MVELALIVCLLFDCNLERGPLSLCTLCLTDSSVSDKKIKDKQLFRCGFSRDIIL